MAAILAAPGLERAPGRGEDARPGDVRGAQALVAFVREERTEAGCLT